MEKTIVYLYQHQMKEHLMAGILTILNLLIKKKNSINPYLFTEDITLVAIYYFEVSTKEDLLHINNDLEATYRLVNDVDISKP